MHLAHSKRVFLLIFNIILFLTLYRAPSFLYLDISKQSNLGIFVSLFYDKLYIIYIKIQVHLTCEVTTYNRNHQVLQPTSLLRRHLPRSGIADFIFQSFIQKSLAKTYQTSKSANLLKHTPIKMQSVIKIESLTNPRTLFFENQL